MKSLDPSKVDLGAISDEQRAILAVQLWNDLFKQMSTIGVAASAGMLILLELNAIPGSGDFFLGLLFFALGSLAAIAGAMTTLSAVERNASNTRMLHHLLSATCGLLGIGAGILGVVFLTP